MKTLKTRLARFVTLARNTAAKAVDTSRSTCVIQDAAIYLCGGLELVALAPVAFVAVVVLGW